MIYFLSILLALQILVVLWLTYKNSFVQEQNTLQKILQEIALLKEKEKNFDEEIKYGKEAIEAQRDMLMEINQKTTCYAILVNYKSNILQKTSKI